MSTNPSTSQPPNGERPNGGQVEVERAIKRAEAAKDKFNQELEGLIEDLHDAREAIRANRLPGEGNGDEREQP